MPKYVAFLRAINVGGHTVKMDQLRDLFLQLNFTNVETFIASGNVIFDSKSKDTEKLERQIEKHLHQALGYPVTTFIRTTGELADVAGFRPFGDADLADKSNQLYVAFIAKEPDAEAIQKLLIQRTKADDFNVNGRQVYWLYRRKFAKPGFQGPPVEKCLGMQATLRNVNTVQRISKKYPCK